MMPISGVNTGAVQPLTTAEKVLGASKVQKPEEEAQGRQLKPVMDEYVPEEPQEPSGRYWMGKDEDGQQAKKAVLGRADAGGGIVFPRNIS